MNKNGVRFVLSRRKSKGLLVIDKGFFQKSAKLVEVNCHLSASYHDLLAIEDIDAGVSGSGGAEGDALEGIPMAFGH
jgi:hypothetical protein